MAKTIATNRTTVSEFLIRNVFNSRLTNKALSHRRELSLKVIRKAILNCNNDYVVYYNWEESNGEHLKFRAEHREHKISVFLHAYVSPIDIRVIADTGAKSAVVRMREGHLYDLVHDVQYGLSCTLRPQWRIA